MTDRPMQLAKRELHDLAGNRPAWASLLAAGALLGLAGPFGTEDVMRLLPRTAYWLFVVTVTYTTGAIMNAMLRPALVRWLPVWGAVPLISLASATVITAQIFTLNVLVFGYLPGLSGLLVLAGNVLLASLIITSAVNYVQARPAPSGAVTGPAATDPPDPALLRRLPLAKRGALISLSAVDHYVEVTTTAGTELLLMRLVDAIAETAPVQGLQIHRSHWVALDQVRDVARAQGKTTLTLNDGRTLPVSRANVAGIKEAGLLP